MRDLFEGEGAAPKKVAHNKMVVEDLEWCVRRIPNELKQVMEILGARVAIGGGFIRSCITGDPINDIDLFVPDIDVEALIIERLTKGEGVPSGVRVYRTRNATTITGYMYPIQIIHRWLYDKPEDVLIDFDFSITCAVLWFNKTPATTTGCWAGLVHPMYYQDLAAKRLRYLAPNRDEDVGGSVLRVLKYYRKGYNITLDSFAGTIARLVSKLVVADLEDHEHTAHILTGLLVEVDPNAVLGSEIVRETQDEA